MAEHRWITIPAGRFRMGSNPRWAAPADRNERPLHRLDLDAFSIGRIPVTNAEYLKFVMATGYGPPGHWLNGAPTPGTETHPVTYVSWPDAMAFCTWAGVRLPTEAEWEKAARGPDSAGARWWPWGDDPPDANRCHFDGQHQGISPAAQGVKPAGLLVDGVSPYGVLDMAGNVAEWTQSRDWPYPYRGDDGREEMQTLSMRVIRGGSYMHGAADVRCSARSSMVAGARDVYIGFRVAADRGVTPRLPLDLVEVPAGSFWMGNEANRTAHAVLPDEFPDHEQEIESFRVATFPVTNAEYLQFVTESGHEPPAHWFAGAVSDGSKEHPVTHVDWHDAQRYCEWAGGAAPDRSRMGVCRGRDGKWQ